MTTPKLPTLNHFAFSAGDSVELTLPQQGTLTVESAQDRVCFMRDFDITRDAVGLALAESILAIVAQAVGVLKADQAAGTLPTELELTVPVVRPNPFV